MKSEIKFRTGVFELNPIPNFDFQLNRTWAWGNGDLDELRGIASNITSSQTWVKEMLKIGEKALAENRIENAIAYFRMAEFFMFHGDPDKIKTYDKAIELFYNYYTDIFNSGVIVRDRIPYEFGYLPVLYTKPEEECVDTIVLHGGFDSYKEEFLPMLLYLREKGFAVYLFEGPGQGEALRKAGLPFTHEWERPVKAVLDRYNLNDVSLVGFSLGAMLAPRAAAFESRISRVVASSLFTNFLEIIIYTRPQKIQRLIKFFMKNKMAGLINKLMAKQMKKDPLAEWGVRHGMHNTGSKTPCEYMVKSNAMQIYDIGDKVTQDFLVFSGEKDHFISTELYKPYIDSFPNVRSMTYRLITVKEKGENHCNVGNTKLVLDTIIAWINVIKNRVV